ncbi:MAG: T9SS type A sorting domain-containing protein [candidate division Zixibacteria bacterium]|nr:T9SS type A sorting domain-containing protein [candidate division Zixibacteria bacterium]
MALTVYADDGNGGPGSVIAGPFEFTAAGDLSFQPLEFPEPIDVGADDFHVAVGIMESPTAHPVFDDDGGTLRTTYHAPGDPWSTVDNLDMVLRAFVRTYGADVTEPELLHIPISMAFSADEEYSIAAKINDQSGINEATVHYSTDGVNYQSATLNRAGDLYQGVLPAQPAGSTVSYYLSATDNAPAYNTGTLPAQAALDPFSFVVHAGEELRHDDGLPEEFWIESDVYDGNAFAVSFWPPSYPAVISHLRVLVDDTASFVLTVQKNSTGSPGDVIAGPFVASADPYSGWADVTIPENERPTITYAGFFVVFYWSPDHPDLPGVATDISAVSNKSYWGDNSFGWNQYTEGDWIMRAAIETTTGVMELGGHSAPTGWTLAQNSPNPFNASTTIEFTLPRASDVNLEIFNVLGQSVRRLHSGFLEPGTYLADWDGRNQSGQVANSGVYFYRLRTNQFTETRKMLLLK